MEEKKEKMVGEQEKKKKIISPFMPYDRKKKMNKIQRILKSISTY